MKNTIKHFEQYGKEVFFSFGEIISDNNLMPKNIYLIKEGKVRIIYSKNGKLDSQKILGPGKIIGIASIFRGSSCEFTLASGPVKTKSLKVDEFLELLKIDKIYDECYSALHAGESTIVIETIISENNFKEEKFQQILNSIDDYLKIVPNRKDLIEQSLNKGERLFLATCIKDKKLSYEIKKYEKWLDNFEIYNLRIISLSNLFDKEILKKNISKKISSEEKKIKKSIQIL